MNPPRTRLPSPPGPHLLLCLCLLESVEQMPAGEEARLPFLARVRGATRALLTRCHCEAGFCPAQAQQAGEMGAEMGAEL